MKKKKEIIDSLKINSKDVGSSEIQIGLLSKKIDNLSDHFKTNKNDDFITLEEYTSNMKKEQKSIFYLTGSNINELKNSPLLEYQIY